MKSEHQKSVESFMRAAGQEVPESPTIPSADVRRLRATLIIEEALETVRALGFEMTKGGDLIDAHEPDIIEVIDGCCDIRVVTTGTLSAFGCPDELFQELIDNSNLKKFSEGSYRRDDGKWIKPPDWEAPKIREALDFLRHQGSQA